ncbi:FGGY-family carbohydrate kinase [Planktotalea sp.]|uniref:FGGY-family carbohydrate kinase n=1 Tax=Planktotalea sp. TaxID=2029877 RepID=UPI00329A1EF3
MMLRLGIDIGTSGVRTAVLDGDEVVSTATTEHPKQLGQAIDANLWWDAVEECLKSQMNALRDTGGDPRLIAGVAVDGTSGSMVLTDSDLNPVSPALMYNSKGFTEEAVEIARHADDAHITKGSNSALARAMRLVKEATEKPCHLLHQADFIAAKLMGQGGHSDFNNALKTGFDPETNAWPEWIAHIIEPSLLPRVHAPGRAIAHVSTSVAETYGLSPDMMVHAGTTDSIAAFLASAPIRESVAVSSLGSTLAIKMLSSTRIDDPSIGLYSHRLGEFWLVGGASNTGGAVLKSFFSTSELVELSTQIDPSKPCDLSYYPLLQPGERFPINDPDLAPLLTPRPVEDAAFLYGLLDGIAGIEAQCYEAINARGGGMPSRIFTAGGGSQNEVWTAIRARHIGVPIETAEYTDAAIGAAKLIVQ